MKKIISLFQRNYDGDRLVRDELVPGAEWVAAGEGVATQKFDGTCCMGRDSKLWKRYDLKPHKKAPAGFEPAQEPDKITGNTPGWVPVGDSPDDTWHCEALSNMDVELTEDSTYELCGPNVQNNTEGYPTHVLIRHGGTPLFDCPRTFDALRDYLQNADIEGVVWHHPDSRMVKIKGKDFGIRRRSATSK